VLQAVLFDLDDTLLGNDMDVFVARYFELLGEYSKGTVDPRRLHDALLRGTRAMFENEDRSRTNADAFWERFTAHAGVTREKGEPFFEVFYRTVFPRLERLTRRRPTARRRVELCAQRGWPVVIATNPVFPLIAIEERLRWAGIPVTEHAFALVTSYETMHSTKPRPDYFLEIADHLGIDPSLILMAGNDPEQDIAPARRCGMQTYTVVDSPASAATDLSERHGTLDDLFAWLTTR
jgi:FMN phosphatase YigB (HAD superfamily)